MRRDELIDALLEECGWDPHVAMEAVSARSRLVPKCQHHFSGINEAPPVDELDDAPDALRARGEAA